MVCTQWLSKVYDGKTAEQDTVVMRKNIEGYESSYYFTFSKVSWSLFISSNLNRVKVNG